MVKRRTDERIGPQQLLGLDDVSPFVVVNPGGGSRFLLLGDHAGRAVPKALAGLGLGPQAMERHIAWDIGVAGLGDRLGSLLDACFIRQAYSRLVVDCNRQPGAADAAPVISDGTPVPGNIGLSQVDMAARNAEIYAPYQDRIAAELDARAAAGRATLLVSLHSFTPVMGGLARPWRFGVLHRNDSPFSRAMLTVLREALGWDVVGDNQPYAMDGTDNTIPLHADTRGLDYLELEVRQDLIEEAAGQDAVAELLALLLARAAS
jgi:predicted N-formylglutamate amidohydrolase